MSFPIRPGFLGYRLLAALNSFTDHRTYFTCSHIGPISIIDLITEAKIMSSFIFRLFRHNLTHTLATSQPCFRRG